MLWWWLYAIEKIIHWKIETTIYLMYTLNGFDEHHTDLHLKPI